MLEQLTMVECFLRSAKILMIDLGLKKAGDEWMNHPHRGEKSAEFNALVCQGPQHPIPVSLVSTAATAAINGRFRRGASIWLGFAEVHFPKYQS